MAALLSDALYLVLPLTCIMAMPPVCRTGALAERFVYGVALYQFLLLVSGLLLGLTGHLTTPHYVAIMAGATCVLVVRGKYHHAGFHWRQAARWLGTRRGVAATLLLGLALSIFALELGFDVWYGTRHGDGLQYHIPRVMFWLQQGNFDPWVTPVAASIGLPVGADLILLHKILLGRGWGGGGYVVFYLAAAAAACVYLAGLELEMKRWSAAMAALLFVSFPAVGLRIWAVNSDIAAAFPALAACVALRRSRDPRIGLALFVILHAMAIACKPTVALPALVLAGMTLWFCRQKISHAWKTPLPFAAAAFGAVLVLASYWPVYMAFGDFLGGEYSRVHRSATIAELVHAAAMHFGYWLLEPLGYLTRFREPWELEALRTFYNALGAQFEALPEMWKPYPGQDSGYTGLAPLFALPLLIAGISGRVRRWVVLIFLLGYLPLSGMIIPQPYFTRYNVLILAGLSLLWGGTRIVAQGCRRWGLAWIVALNLCALFGVVVINIYLHATTWSQPGGNYHYLSASDREMITESLHGRPLLVMTESSAQVSTMDALLTGPQIAFPLRYVICPVDGDWDKELRLAAGHSNWLALMHGSRDTIVPGPEFTRPGSHTCSATSTRELERALVSAGWSRYRQDALLDLWQHL